MEQSWIAVLSRMTRKHPSGSDFDDDPIHFIERDRRLFSEAT